MTTEESQNDRRRGRADEALLITRSFFLGVLGL
jgi:hypothetical protein